MLTPRVRIPLAIVAGAFLAGLLLGGAVAIQAQVRLDHFTCYTIDAPIPAFTVRIADQFTGVDLRVGAPRFLCTPTKKAVLRGAPLQITGNHLECYAIEGRDARAGVALANQFGRTKGIRVGAARLLCVPTSKVRQ